MSKLAPCCPQCETGLVIDCTLLNASSIAEPQHTGSVWSSFLSPLLSDGSAPCLGLGPLNRVCAGPSSLVQTQMGDQSTKKERIQFKNFAIASGVRRKSNTGDTVTEPVISTSSHPVGGPSWFNQLLQPTPTALNTESAGQQPAGQLNLLCKHSLSSATSSTCVEWGDKRGQWADQWGKTRAVWTVQLPSWTHDQRQVPVDKWRPETFIQCMFFESVKGCLLIPGIAASMKFNRWDVQEPHPEHPAQQVATHNS